MKRGPASPLAFALLTGALAAACHRANGGAANETRGAAHGKAGAPAALDSLEGVVRVVGVDALPQVTLAPDDGSPSVTLDGPPSLRSVTGLRIAAAGDRTGSRLTVRRFIVLSANGVPATDGVLAKDGGAVVLVTRDGTRHHLVSPPPLLRGNAGRRAWVSGPLDRAPVAYGIIE